MKKESLLTVTAKNEIVDCKTMSLEEIEAKMMSLACDESDDIVRNMVNERKISMLEKVANLRIKRLQLKQLEQENVVDSVEPVTVEFIEKEDSADQRIKEMEELVERQLGMQHTS